MLENPPNKDVERRDRGELLFLPPHSVISLPMAGYVKRRLAKFFPPDFMFMQCPTKMYGRLTTAFLFERGFVFLLSEISTLPKIYFISPVFM